MSRKEYPCRFCVAADERGEDIRKTSFFYLAEHLLTHGMSRKEAKREASLARAASGRTASGDVYWICMVDGCGHACSNKKKHLKGAAHNIPDGTPKMADAMTRFSKGSESYRRLVSARVAARGNSTHPESDTINGMPEHVQYVGMEQGAAAGPGSELEAEPEAEEKAEPESEPEAEPEAELEVETVPLPVSEYPLMTSKDITFEKHARLVTRGRRAHPLVVEWHKFKISSAGGSRRRDQHFGDVGYVSRFLATGDIKEDGLNQVSTHMVVKHMEDLQRHVEAVTIHRSFKSVLNFWEWAMRDGHIHIRKYTLIKLYLQGCKGTNYKNLQVRKPPMISPETSTRAVSWIRNTVDAMATASVSRCPDEECDDQPNRPVLSDDDKASEAITIPSQLSSTAGTSDEEVSAQPSRKRPLLPLHDDLHIRGVSWIRNAFDAWTTANASKLSDDVGDDHLIRTALNVTDDVTNDVQCALSDDETFSEIITISSEASSTAGSLDKEVPAQPSRKRPLPPHSHKEDTELLTKKKMPVMSKSLDQLIAPRKKRTYVDDRTRRSIKDAYAEVIAEFSCSLLTIPIHAVRILRKGRWPELSEGQIRDLLRNMVKHEKKRMEGAEGNQHEG